MIKINFLKRITLLCCCLFASMTAFAQEPDLKGLPVNEAESEKWRADLRYMAEEMPKWHNNLYHKISREEFVAAVKQLHERIPQLARHEIIVEMAKIVARVGDGHTNIYPTRDPKIAFHSLPIKLYLFKDGLFVRAAAGENAKLVGARVLKIGNFSPAEAVLKVREMVGRDNAMGVNFFAAFLLTIPEVLHALKISDRIDAVSFVVEQADKKRQTVRLKQSGLVEMLPADTDTSWLNKEGWVDMRDNSSGAKPLWLKDPLNKFWFEYLPETRIVYAQINQVMNKDGETLADFSARLLASVEADQAEKLVLDLRLNRGGNGTLLRPLVVDLIRSKFNRKGKLFAIIGRSTWSASQFLLNDLEQYTNVQFVGEPSGSRGNVYGDSRRITLPNSGMTVRVSVYYWQDWSPWDTRPWTAPHLTAELASEDYRSNVDPALNLIQKNTPPQSLSEILREALAKGGVDSAIRRFREFKTEAVNKYAFTEEPLLVFGQELLDAKKPEQALEIFKLVAEESPDSFRSYHALGEAYFRMGNKELAVKNLKKSLEINPKNYDVSERLKQMRQK
jgi:tetratricopeptide (TPR) repeat protein